MEWLCRTLLKCALALLVLAALAAGIGVYLCLLSPSLRHAFERFAGNVFALHPVPVHLAATALLLIVLLVVWAQLFLHRLHGRALVISTTEGSVRISAAMLSRFVRYVIQGCDGVRNVSVQTVPDRRKMSVIASVAVCAHTPVSIVAGRLQQHVRRRVLDVFGVDLLRDIRIEITGVAMDENAPRGLLAWRAPQTSPAPADEAPVDAAPVLASS